MRLNQIVFFITKYNSEVKNIIFLFDKIIEWLK